MLLGMVAFSNGTGPFYAHIDFVFHSVCVDKWKLLALWLCQAFLNERWMFEEIFFLNFFEWGFLPFWFPSAPERAIRWVSRILVWEKRMGRYRKGDIINRDEFWGRVLCQARIGLESWDLWGRRQAWAGLLDLATVSVFGLTRGHSFLPFVSWRWLFHVYGWLFYIYAKVFWHADFLSHIKPSKGKPQGSWSLSIERCTSSPRQWEVTPLGFVWSLSTLLPSNVSIEVAWISQSTAPDISVGEKDQDAMVGETECFLHTP